MSDWKSVDEWTPPDGKRVLVFANRGSKPLIEISTFNLVELRWDGFDVDEITHWAEMPGSPPLAVFERSFPLPSPKIRPQELFDHLVVEFLKVYQEDEAVEYADYCVNSLVLDMGEYVIADREATPIYSDYRETMEASQEARWLYRLCRDNPYLEKYAANCWALSNNLMVSARDLLQEIPKKRGKGRPPLTRCREELIKRIYGHYPKELRKKRYESNFETTVKMILDWVEPSPPKDIHAAIIRALGCKNEFQ